MTQWLLLLGRMVTDSGWENTIATKSESIVFVSAVDNNCNESGSSLHSETFDSTVLAN
jgi:hypothetical protein